MKKAKQAKKNTKPIDDASIWAKMKPIVRVHIVSNGILTIRKATTVDGVEEYYNWNKKADRDLVRNTTTSDAEIIVDDNVTKGWDWDDDKYVPGQAD